MPLVLSVLKHVMLWLAVCLEWGSRIREASDDPLGAPLYRAANRARRIDPRQKDAIAEEAAKSEFCRSGAKLSQAMHRFIDDVFYRPSRDPTTGNTRL